MPTTPPPQRPQARYWHLLWLILVIGLICLACGTLLGWGVNDLALPDVG